ncbi:MAG: N-acetylmuramoyl-L-alanine amidase, partial [Paludibacter sp.]|nr:N-acetylmuramoyl-L-alanine amidase [Paludibacter sp.]
QILASNRKLAANAAELKGERAATFFYENGLYKYTLGAETDYNKIKELQKTVRKKFPDCFVIAFAGEKKLTEKEAVKL